MVLIRRDRERWYGPFGHSYMDFRYVHAIIKGRYNDYGWIGERCGDFVEVLECDWEDYENRVDDKFYIIFFHRSVWDACQKFHAENKEGNWQLSVPERIEEIDGKLVKHKNPDFSDELAVVCCIANITRRGILSGCQFRGCQDWGTTETYRFVHQQTAARLKEKISAERACEEEDEQIECKGQGSSEQTTGKVRGDSKKPKKKR